MATFSYRGRDKAGELVSGNIDASSTDAVASQLMSSGVTPVAIDEVVESASFEMPEFFQKKITSEELIMFTRQMYSLSRSGVPLNKAIRGLADSIENKRLTDILIDVERSLNAGVTLSVSFARHRDVFDDLFINIIQVGENSGRLDIAFKQLSQYMELDKDTQRRIVSAVRYPMFVFGAIAIAVVVLNIWVIPVFADMFAKFNAELPLPTQILIGTSRFFVEDWPWLLAFAVLLVAGVRHYVNTEAGRLQWDKRKLRLPLIGTILERSTLARYGRSFSLMLKSGVSLIQALELSSRAVANEYMGMKIRGMRESIQRGESLLRAATSSGMFTPLVLQMIQVGEETGRVDELLEEVADFYEQEVDYDLKSLASYIEPILIACIAGLVMVLALGIFLPMWDMMSVMQGK